MLDKRLLLRIIYLALQAIAYNISASQPTPPNHDDLNNASYDMMRRLVEENRAIDREKANECIDAAKHTFSLLARQAGYTLDKLERD